MVAYISQFFAFWRVILSCLPVPVLTFFYAVLSIFIFMVFVKLFISWV